MHTHKKMIALPQKSHYVSIEFHQVNRSGQEACINGDSKLMAVVYFFAMENIYLIWAQVLPPTAW